MTPLSLMAAVQANEWVLAMVWAPWTAELIGRAHKLPTVRAVAAAAVDLAYRCGKDASVLTVKMRCTAVVPAEHCEHFRRRVFGGYMTKEVGVRNEEPQCETVTSLLSMEPNQFPALRLFWKGRSFQPVGPWKRVCSDYRGPMEELAIREWVFARKALAKVEAQRATTHIQTSWRVFHCKRVFDAAATVQKWSRGYLLRSHQRREREAKRKAWLMEQVRRKRANEAALAATEMASLAAADAQWYWEDAHELVKWSDEQQWLAQEAGRRAAEDEAFLLLARRHPRLFPDAPLCHCCIGRINGTLPDSIFGPGMDDGDGLILTEGEGGGVSKSKRPTASLQIADIEGSVEAAKGAAKGTVAATKAAAQEGDGTSLTALVTASAASDGASDAESEEKAEEETAVDVRALLEDAASIWTEFEDEESAAPYWYNAETGEAVWESPDVVDALHEYIESLPPPFVPPRLAMVVCTECDLPFCRQCHIDLHSHGAKRAHSSVAVVPEDFVAVEGLCALCTGRSGCIFCPSCDERFCEQCVVRVHSHGARAHHTWIPLPQAQPPSATLPGRHFENLVKIRAARASDIVPDANGIMTPQRRSTRGFAAVDAGDGEVGGWSEIPTGTGVGGSPGAEGALVGPNYFTPPSPKSPTQFLSYFRSIEMTESALTLATTGGNTLPRSEKKRRRACVVLIHILSPASPPHTASLAIAHAHAARPTRSRALATARSHSYLKTLKARREAIVVRMKRQGWRSWNDLQANRFRRLRLDALVAEHSELLRLAFDRYDEDGSETIDVRELGILMRHELCEPMSKKALTAAIESMDDDGSGEVDFDEFARWFVEEIMLNPGRGNARLKLLQRSLTFSKEMRKRAERANAAKRVLECTPGMWVRVKLRTGEGEETTPEEDAALEMRLFGTKIPDVPGFGAGEDPSDAALSGVTAADRTKPSRPSTVRAKILAHVAPEAGEEASEEAIAKEKKEEEELKRKGVPKSKKQIAKEEAEKAKGLRRLVHCFDVQTWDGHIIERVPWQRVELMQPVRGQHPSLGVYEMHMDDIEMFRVCLERYSAFRHGFAISIANSKPDNVTQAFHGAFVKAWNHGGLPKSLYFEGREFVWPEPPPFDEVAAGGDGDGEGDGADGVVVAEEATAEPRPEYFMPNVDKPKKLGKDRRLQPGWDNGEPVLWRMKWDDAIDPHGGWTYVQPGTGGHNRFGDFCPEFSQREDPVTMTTKHDDIMHCFVRYDVDDSGEIDEDELRQLLVKELAIPVTDESLAQAMSEMDVDGDGAVVPEELLKWFARQSHMDHSHSVRAKELELLARRAVRNVGRTILAKIIPSEQQRLENKRKKEEASEARRMKLLRLGTSGPLLALINAGYVA